MAAKDNGSTPFPPIWIEVECDRAPFAGIVVEINAMATREQRQQWDLDPEAEDAPPVVRNVKNWPIEGGNPWGNDAPIAFRGWLMLHGWQKATTQWLSDPNSPTA